MAGADFTRPCARDVFMSCLIGVVLAATGCGLELLEGAVQAFLMGRGKGLKLYPDPVRAGPTYNGPLDQNWDLCFGEIEQKIHLHSRGGSKGAFKPTSFAR